MTEVEYLGVIVTPDGMRMDPTKVNAILNWPPLQNIKEVQSFLGFANFYCHFINNYSGITKPLNRLTWKDTPWDWDSKCQSIFLLLKKAFTSTPVFHHFNPSLPISDAGGKDLHPVAFYTQLMIPMELNYDIYDKELLMIVEAFSSPLPITWRPTDKQNKMTGVQNSPSPSLPTTRHSTLPPEFSPSMPTRATTPDSPYLLKTSPPTSPTKLLRTSDPSTSSSGTRSIPPIKPTPSMPMPDAN
ncbi:hypothetical protein E4T56_gene9793 [Termitomyces sp. T112]|nr:hypothetical protein E4T56_gene9793 [Termitomyces sp. T112]